MTRVRIDPAAAAARLAAPAAGQVDLAPRGAGGDDDAWSPVARAQLPRRRRHQRHAGRHPRGRRAWSRTAPDELVIRGTGLRARRRGRRARSTSATPARSCACCPGWLAGQPGGPAVDDRRRRVDPPPPGRPHRRAAAGDGRAGSRPPRAAIRRSRSTARACTAIHYDLPVASAQVKSCTMLAGARRRRRDLDLEPTRPATTPSGCSLRAGVPVRREGSRVIVPSIDELELDEITCPATCPRPRSSSPPACSCPDRACASRTSASTGRGSASCACSSAWGRSSSATSSPRARRRGPSEPVSDLDVAAGAARGHDRRAARSAAGHRRAAAVALLGCFAEGETVVRGASELRFKESDRIAGVVDGLRGLGADIEATDDGFVVRGTGGLRGGSIASRGDHRLAMLGAVAGLASQEGVEVVGMDAAAVSYPGFPDDLAALVVDGGRDRRSRRGREVDGRARAGAGARLHLSGLRRDVPQRRRSPGPTVDPASLDIALARRPRAARRPRRHRGHPHARGLRGRLARRGRSQRARGDRRRSSASCWPTATGSPRAATSAPSSRPTPR